MTTLDADTEARFVEMMTDWLISLPHDLKILFDVIDDENMPREGRELAVGTVIYLLSTSDFVSDRSDSFASYADDCLLMRLALRQIVSAKTEDTEYFESRYPDFFEKLADELTLCSTAMDEVYTWLESKVSTLRTLDLKGKSIKLYLDDEEASTSLYDDGLAFRTEYPVDGEMLSDRFKKASTVLDVMRRRKAEDLRE